MHDQTGDSAIAYPAEVVGGDKTKGNTPDSEQHYHKVGLKPGIWYVFQRIEPYVHNASPDVDHKHCESSEQRGLVHMLFPLVIVCWVPLVFYFPVTPYQQQVLRRQYD